MPKTDFRMLQLFGCRTVAQKSGRVALILKTDRWVSSHSTQSIK
jgi:hypothetical protein